MGGLDSSRHVQTKGPGGIAEANSIGGDWYHSPAYESARHIGTSADYAAAIVESAKSLAAPSIPE
jgi:hypothetical protein